MYRSDVIDLAPEKEPPSFLVGCDEQNRWVAVEVHGLCGGYFADRAAALKFAHEQTSGRQGAIRLVTRVSPF